MVELASGFDASGDPPVLDRVVFRSAVASIAAFRCPTGHPRFRDSGPAENHIFVFPRRRVRLRHDRGRPFLADPTVVTLYNRGQVYFRDPVDGAGDECEWFAVQDELLLEAVRHFDPWVDDRPERPFRHAYGPCGAREYLLQRTLFDRLRRGAPVDPLSVDEAVVDLLATVLSGAYAFWGPARGRAATIPRHREAVEQTRRLLSESLGDPLPLAHVAGKVGLSPFHLCRLFRATTGCTLHAYRSHLRLREALDRLADGVDLTALALDLGYSSHSHFSDAFKRAFGVAPSAARRRLSGWEH